MPSPSVTTLTSERTEMRIREGYQPSQTFAISKADGRFGYANLTLPQLMTLKSILVILSVTLK